MDNIKMDGHKLMFHPIEVSKWLRGEEVYPVTMEISPSGACNHRCIFCSQSYLGYKSNFIKSSVILENARKMKENGVKAIVLAGEGEPLLNHQITDIIHTLHENRIDVAMSTNAALLTKEKIEGCLPYLSWIRVSFNGANSKLYNKIHGLSDERNDFFIVLNNLKDAVDYKLKNNLKITIGVQMILLPENIPYILEFAKQLRRIGVDYFTIKPFSKHPQMEWEIENESQLINDFKRIKNDLRELSTSKFKVIIREESINTKDETRKYNSCLGIPFWAYISANGDVYPCLSFIGDSKKCYGNVNESSFDEIWSSQKRMRITKSFENMDISQCRKLCRLDKINNYLDELVNPSEHKNFI